MSSALHRMVYGTLLLPSQGARHRARRWRRGFLGATVLLLGAVGGVLLSGDHGAGTDTHPGLTVYVQHARSVRAVAVHGSIHTGDGLSLTYSAPQGAWLGVWRQTPGALERVFSGHAAAGDDVPLPVHGLRAEVNQAFFGVFCPPDAAGPAVSLDGNALHAPAPCVVRQVQLHL